jgi:hypothetical protein
LENGEYTAVNSVVVCVRKRVKEEEWLGSPNARSEPHISFSYFKHFVNIIVDNFETSHTDRC